MCFISFIHQQLKIRQSVAAIETRISSIYFMRIKQWICLIAIFVEFTTQKK